MGGIGDAERFHTMRSTLGTVAALKTALEKSAAACKIVDDWLAANEYLAGKNFTIGDIPLGVWV
jgi:glutathione S-transferase